MSATGRDSSRLVAATIAFAVIVIVALAAGRQDSPERSAAPEKARRAGQGTVGGSDATPGSDDETTPPGDIPPSEEDRPPGQGVPVEDTFAAESMGSESSPISTSILWPVRNGWQVSSHRQMTAIFAGGSRLAVGEGRGSPRPHTGRFVILRTHDIRGTQDLSVVDVPDAGAVEITEAPLGRGPVQRISQIRGEFRFEGKRGATGTLFLRNDSVELDH